MPKRMVGVKFIFKSQQWISLAFPEDEAFDIVRNWASGQYRLKGVQRLTGTSPAPEPGTPPFHYALDLDEVVAVHTFDLEEVQRQVHKQSPRVGPYNPGMSGFPN